MFISIWITDKHPSLLDIRSKEKMQIVGLHIEGRQTKKNKAIIAGVDYLKKEFAKYTKDNEMRRQKLQEHDDK